MITESQLPELSVFRKVERRLPLCMSDNSGNLVVQGENDSLPVHGWFRFKESFSADLLAELLSHLGGKLGKRFRLLDPFCGVGTTLVAAQEMSAQGYEIQAVGIERNPFIRFVAQSKVGWPRIDPGKLLNIGERILRNRTVESKKQIPPLSSLTTGRCLSRYFSKRFVSLRDAIIHDGSSATHNAALLGLASAIEPVSNIRKDGRALRIVERNPQRLDTILRSRWETIAEDTTFLQKRVERAGLPTVIEGDGRRPSKSRIRPGSIDLVLTSPPYPNNIDYSEVYKLELWLLGFIKSREAFLGLRKKTFRSHPTCRDLDHMDDFMTGLQSEGIFTLLDPILKRMENTGEPWRRKVLLGYCHDMWVTLKEQYQCLRKGGYSVVVVGNSLHGGTHLPYLIPTDIMVAVLAESVGFEIQEIAVARSLRRRLKGNHFLRESMVILRK